LGRTDKRESRPRTGDLLLARSGDELYQTGSLEDAGCSAGNRHNPASGIAAALAADWTGRWISSVAEISVRSGTWNMLRQRR